MLRSSSGNQPLRRKKRRIFENHSLASRFEVYASDNRTTSLVVTSSMRETSIDGPEHERALGVLHSKAACFHAQVGFDASTRAALAPPEPTEADAAGDDSPGRFTELQRRASKCTWVSPNTLGRESKVTVGFEPKGDNTLMTLVHSELPDHERARSHDKGWTYFLGLLTEQLGEIK